MLVLFFNYVRLYVFLGYFTVSVYGSRVAQLVKNLPAMQETLVRFLDRKLPWRRDRLPTPVFLSGESLWTENPGLN